MSKELSVSLSPAAAAPARVSKLLQAAGIILGGSALAAVCAHVSIPLFFTPVPLSLQPFAVLLLGLLLTPRMAAATFAAYLLEGAAGLPVFAPSPAIAGLAHLFGPTGGYLLAFPLAAALISFLWSRTDRGFAAAILCAATGDLAILTCGAVWLAAIMPLSALPAATLAVLPFLPGDALKIAAAAGMAVGFFRIRRGDAA
ncbi:MAG: biotin transporter BioY [Terracidiphilus sp.]|jgi:biotin transport system substrate-specific component